MFRLFLHFSIKNFLQKSINRKKFLSIFAKNPVFRRRVAKIRKKNPFRQYFASKFAKIDNDVKTVAIFDFAGWTARNTFVFDFRIQMRYLVL
jgi:hypothetical protein